MGLKGWANAGLESGDSISPDRSEFKDFVWSNLGNAYFNLKLKPIIVDCRRICLDFQEALAWHILKEANSAADFLAKLARAKAEGELDDDWP